MSSPVVTIDVNKTAKDAAIMLKKMRKGCLIVTKKKNPVGILTSSDLVRKVVAKNLRPTQVKVKDVMSKPLIFVDPDETITSAAAKFKQNNIHRVPVIKNGKLVGILSYTDIAIVAPEMLDILEQRMKSEEMPIIKEEITSGICENCGHFSENLRFKNGQWICETCREEMESEL